MASNQELVVNDELDMAIGDPNSSGLISRGILDEVRNPNQDTNEENTKPSGRFHE